MSLAVPGISLPKSNLDKLAEDLAKLEIPTVVKVGKSQASVPSFQRQGYLEKLGHARMKWFKRFFVLRDSFLLSYNLQKSDFTVEPRAAIHLGGCTIQLLEHAGKEFCFLITTMQKDRFLFAADTDEDRKAWVRDLDEAKTITHSNMIKLAVENQCLAEDKGAAGIVLDNTATALAIFSNVEYIKNTPMTGGAEGWLRTNGFNAEEQGTEKKGLASLIGKNRPALTKCYFILRDSHILMFHGGDVLTKPRGVMYLLGTEVVVGNDEETPDGEFHFSVKSQECGDEIGLVASSNKVRNRWMQALRIGGRVTYPDFTALLKEHELLSKISMTPRAAPQLEPNKPAPPSAAPPVPLFHEETDVAGEQLDPGTQQAFDIQGVPLIRNPEGKLVNPESGDLVDSSEPRFGVGGEQLDPFNRPLPPGAVPMFTADKQPVGVGPDGEHYLPDGSTVAKSDPHFDSEGNQLDQETVDAAGAIAANVSVALKIRQRMKGDHDKPDMVDVLGRTFRGEENEDGLLINADGDAVPLASARNVETSTGQLVEYSKQRREPEAMTLVVKLEDAENEAREIGTVEIDETTTLRDLRKRISNEIDTEFPDFVFLLNGIPLLKYEENDKLATVAMPEIEIRGKELKPVPKSTFNTKVNKISERQRAEQEQQTEFDAIMSRVREGKFLRSTRLLDP